MSRKLTRTEALRRNLAMARMLWPEEISGARLEALRALCLNHQFSVAAGDLQLVEGRWYVTHSGLLHVARRARCSAIKSVLLEHFSDPSAHRWTFKATVYKRVLAQGFVGYGDADPSNTTTRMRGAEMRIAETRAVNRALRKAYGIGLCSVEELGYAPRSSESAGSKPNGFTSGNVHGSNGQPKLRDQLCLLIRKYNLDPYQVKRYAADFCGTEELRAASRELVESFVTRLGDEAAKDRAALVCKLNSYGHAEEVKS
jgi:hypothetical protein